MISLPDLISQGNGNLSVFIPGAIVLGALHGLEPGHSKTMMAAFIIAIRGTVRQAALLGLSATLSHTAIVWLIALAGLYFGQKMDIETSEPYFQIASALLIFAIAFWIIRRTWHEQQEEKAHNRTHHHHYHYDHPHDHSHDHNHDHLHNHDHVHEDEAHAMIAACAYQDAHELAHAADIERRFSGRPATTGQIVMFGLTGGLIPCPAAITVLLLCLQLKRLTLGAALVLCFSIGLALTMVTAGVAAALSLRYISQASPRWGSFAVCARRAPYISGLLIVCIGLYIGLSGVFALAHG